MSLVSPIHSAKPGTRVHHNNNRCTERNNIETHNVRQGAGGHPLCDRCAELNRQGV
jgi:hypothetical protein